MQLVPSTMCQKPWNTGRALCDEQPHPYRFAGGIRFSTPIHEPVSHDLFGPGDERPCALCPERRVGETLIGVNLLEANSGTGAATDLDGKYRLELKPGTANIRVTYVGYQKLEEVLDLKAGEVRILNFSIEEEARLMDQVVVTGSRFEKKLGEETVSMEIIQPRQLEQINAVQIDDAIERVPGVNVIDGQVNIRAGAGYSYGAGTRVLLLYNDMPILQADAGFPNWSERLLHSTDPAPSTASSTCVRRSRNPNPISASAASVRCSIRLQEERTAWAATKPGGRTARLLRPMKPV
jgi:hypothetical protein